jgi:hypothetical protein
MKTRCRDEKVEKSGAEWRKKQNKILLDCMEEKSFPSEKIIKRNLIYPHRVPVALKYIFEQHF